MIRVVLVEDDRDLLDDIAFSLRDENLRVATCADVQELDRLLVDECFDVVVLDIGLPGEDGLSIVRRLRRTQQQLGIIMLTARTAARDRVQGMEDGADVYLGKPVDLRELALVIRAMVRCLGVGEASYTQELTLLVTENVLITSVGKRIDLSPSEVLILSRLSRATGNAPTNHRSFRWRLPRLRRAPP